MDYGHVAVARDGRGAFRGEPGPAALLKVKHVAVVQVPAPARAAAKRTRTRTRWRGQKEQEEQGIGLLGSVLQQGTLRNGGSNDGRQGGAKHWTSSFVERRLPGAVVPPQRAP